MTQLTSGASRPVLALILLVSVVPLGCGRGGDASHRALKQSGAGKPAPGAPLTSSRSALDTEAPGEAISFRGLRVPAGYSAEYTVRNKTAFPGRVAEGEITADFRLELLESGGGRHVWKVTENDAAQTTGHAFVRHGFANHGKTFFLFTDDFGNLIGTQGGNPLRSEYFGEFPTAPVRVGDSWEGFHTERGARHGDVYRLAGVWTKDGRRIARIGGRIGMRGGYTLGYRIIDLSTNQELEAYQHGTFTNWQGIRVEAEMRSRMVRTSTEK